VLAVIKAEHADRNAAMVAAYQTGEYSYQQIAEHFGVHFMTVGRIVRAAKTAKAAVARPQQ
jgi:transposase